MKICTLFDKYRDGELSGVEKREFEAHLAECSACRAKMSLLNNLTHILRQDPAVMPLDLSGQIARKAFQQNKTWDALVIGWLKPGPAFAALALACVLFSALWFMPNYQPSNASSEYQMLLNEANAITLDSSIQQIQSDTELISQLEQKVRSQ
jgi:hypothetical protein